MEWWQVEFCHLTAGHLLHHSLLTGTTTLFIISKVTFGFALRIHHKSYTCSLCVAFDGQCNILSLQYICREQSENLSVEPTEARFNAQRISGR